MHGELKEIFDFLKTVRPFDELPGSELEQITRQLTIRYFKRQQQIINLQEKNEFLHIVRTGAVEITDANDDFVTRLHEGESFGYLSLIKHREAANSVHAFEDCLIYQLSEAEFDQLCEKYSGFKDYYLLAEAQRLHKVIAGLKNKQFHPGSTFQLPVNRAIKREPVTVFGDISIHQAAVKMTEENVTTLLIVDQDRQLAGIVTDKDLRSRVTAQNLDHDKPIGSIMTNNLITIEADTMAFEANLLMMQHNIHHLPVFDGKKLIGLVSTTDLLKLIDQSPIYTIAEIYKTENPDQLAEISKKIPQLLTHLVESGLSAFQVGQLISNIGENINIRLLQLAEAQLGEPPVKYAWLAAGSLGRREQLLHSDQDNALLLSNKFDPEQHGEYFNKLAKFVSDGLNQCGYVYCPGDVMATNPKWCQTLENWKHYFSKWITEPEPMALMYCSIFFDMRCIYGNQKLFNKLTDYYLKLGCKNSMFLGYLSVNALQNTPPIGFFRRFVLVDDKEHSHHLDLKKRGTAPIVDLARVYTLAAGLDKISTYNRILQAKEVGELSEKAANNLLDAYEFINQFRMQHQARQVMTNVKPDNYANPDELSSFERDHLRDAFKVVEDMQTYLSTRYTASHMR